MMKLSPKAASPEFIAAVYFCFLCHFAFPVCAQTNSWTNSVSGKWENAASWSLGAAPAGSDAADLITNAGNKTVSLDATTAGSFPGTMAVSNLVLSAPNGVTNTLFLSNIGTNFPLVIHKSVVITTGGALLMTNSLVSVDSPSNGVFSLDGTGTLSSSGVLLGTNNGALIVGNVGAGKLIAAAGTNTLSGNVFVGFSTNSAGSVSVAGGQLVFTNAYTVIGFYGSGQIAQSNGTLQPGDDGSLPNGTFLGLTSGSQGVLSIVGGNCVSPGHFDLGEDPGSTGLVWISGGQLILTNNYLTTIGGNGVGQLVLSNGQFAASHVTVADSHGSLGLLTIAGGTGTFSGGFVIGNGMMATGIVSLTGGQLTVTNEGLVVGSYGVGQLLVSNSTVLAATVNVGNSTGSVGTLRIAGGASLLASNVTAGVLSNATGLIQVTGGNLIVTNQSGTGQLIVGRGGNGSFVQNGGSVVADQLVIATGVASNIFVCCTNFIYVSVGAGQAAISNGLLLARSLNIGVSSPGTLTIAGGATSVSSNVVAGVISNAIGTIQISGGSLNVTNQSGTARLVVGQGAQGALAQNGGVLTVDQLLVTNGNSSVVSFSSGLINTKATTVSNAQMFVVGDGVSAATYHLLGGVHSFADGLRIRSNAILSGCGTINGSVQVDAGGLVLADCGGSLTFTGIVTNNGSLKAVNGSTLESYGLVVNNGVINLLDGNTNFHAGFVNNGVVLDSNSVPQIISVAAVGSDIEVEFTTASNLTYVFEYRGNLLTGSWTPLGGFSGPGGNIIWTDFNAALQTQRFYRVRLVVPP